MNETPKEAARRLSAPALAKGFKPVALHAYTDTNGEPIYWRIRAKHGDTGEKWIRPMKLNGQGYELGEPKFTDGKPLYRLHHFTSNPDAVVWITEGEQKADALGKLGLVATTSGGATSADTADWQPLRERTVRIWPDNDEPGKGYAGEVAKILLGKGCAVSCVDVDRLGLDEGDDVMEWLAAHPGAAGGDVEAMPSIEAHPHGASAPAGDADSNEWPKPHPLTVKVEPEPYPLDALPKTIRAAVKEVAGFVKAPVPLVASSALAAISLAIQAHVDVRRDEILSGPASLFLLAIADSGERKTQADKMFSKAIQDYQDAQAEAAKPILKDNAAAFGAWEAKRGGIKDKIRQLAKENKPTASLESDLRDLEHSKPEPPRVPKLIREDATPEGLAKKLQNDWPSAGVISNEAGIVFGAHGMSSESVMRNLALLNKLWDGGRYQSDRGDEERSRDVRGARLTMGLMIQESTLRAFFEQTKGLARGTGFLARFLVALPDSTMGTRFYTPPVTGSPAMAAFNRRITEILNQPTPIDGNGILTPPVLPLAVEAKAAWVAFHDTIEGMLGAGGELHEVKDVASKTADNAVRLAALFQVFEHGMGGAIGADAFADASDIAAWHLSESRRFLGELALPPELADAARLDTWLIAHCKRERTQAVGKNHVRQHGPLRDGKRLDAAIRELSELARLRRRANGKKLTVQVNPALVAVAT